MSRRAPMVALAASAVASIGGAGLSSIASPWLALTTPGSPILTGVVGLCEQLPYVVARALLGPLIDRIGARRIVIWCDRLSDAAVALMPLLFWAGLMSFPVLLPTVALLGMLRAPADAAKQTLVPAVAGMGELSLERVTGVMGASERLPCLLLYTIGFFCAGPLPMAVFALNLPVPQILGVLLLAGLAAGFLNPIVGTILFERIPAPMAGRVVALVGH